MQITLTTPIRGPVDLVPEQIVAAMYAKGEPYYERHQVEEYAQANVELSGAFGFRTSTSVGQQSIETGFLWSRAPINQVHPSQFNFGGVGATNDGAPGLKAESIWRGVLIYYCHLALYVYGLPEHWPEHLRQYSQWALRKDAVEWAHHNTKLPSGAPQRFLAAAQVVGDFKNGIWAYNDRLPRGTLENRYAERIATFGNELRSYPGGGAMRAATDRFIERLRERGREVIDLRGALSVKGAPYGAVPGGLGGVKHIAHHWSGDSFSREWYRVRLGDPNISDGPIPATLTVEQERKVIDFYHEYHQSAHNWPGIAYGTLIFPSGRIYVIYDIGTLTYHAFNTNSVSYAVCNPISSWAEPTHPQLVGTNHVWDVLCNHTPEIPANHTMLFGHQEFSQAHTRGLPGHDAQNATSCPGTVLSHVQHFRQTNQSTVPLDLHAGDRHALFFDETGHWLSNGFRGFWQEKGGLGIFGFPISEEFEDQRGERTVVVQYFERARMEWQPAIANDPYGVVLGLLGSELVDHAELRRAYPEAFARRARFTI